MLVFYWKLDDESTAMGSIGVDSHEPMMVGDYTGNDCQTEPGTTLLGGEVWLEDPRAVARIDTRTIIAYFEGNYTTAWVDRGG